MSAPDIGGPVPVPGSEDGIVRDSRPCTRCSYDLRGLPLAGMCPECGASVAESMRGILLRYAAPEYITTIRSGHSLVLNGILLSIVMGVAAFLVALPFMIPSPAGSAPGSPPGITLLQVQLIMQLVLLGVYVMVFVGYLKATAPDPGFVGIEKPDAARNVARGAVVAQLAVQVLTILISLFELQGLAGGVLTLAILKGGVGVLAYLVWAVQFFAMMRYERWLGARIPDAHIANRTRTYMWLLPVLATIGVLVVIGPLVALVLYWNLLDRMRKYLKSIEATGQPANLPKMFG